MSERRTSAVYVISVFAELAGVHPQTLRNYERTGLLNPARTAGGSRRFSDADLEEIQRIQQLSNEGINLEGIKRILLLERENAALRHELQARTAPPRRDLQPWPPAPVTFVIETRR
jgi:MerR family transcriptional regulator/heat shock protein HspR